MAARLTAYVVVGIVAATLIAGLIVGAQRDDSEGPVDLIVHNAKVYTADDRGTFAEAVAIRGNQILRVGAEREVLRLRRPQTVMIDADGAAVLPGFNDAHVHFLEGGLTLDRIDLTGAATLADIQERIRTWAEMNPQREWVLGRGWAYDAFPGVLPNRHMLDAVVPDRPAQLLSNDGQTAWVNTEALRLAGITAESPEPASGRILRELRSGEPTGILQGAAIELVGRLVPPPSEPERHAALRAATAQAHRYGITSVQNALATPEDLELFREAQRADNLELRVYSAAAPPGLIDDEQLDALEAIRRRHADDPLFKTGAVAIALDGVVETRTAAVLEPYADSFSNGTTAFTPDELNRMVRLLDARGWQIMTHATGDRAVRMALDAYRHAARSNRQPARGRRHRIEHAELIDAADIPRFSGLGVIASTQPFRGSPTPGHLEVWSRNLGLERAARAWPYGSIAEEGGRLTFGSDWPARPLNPLLGIYTAVTRMSLEGRPEGGWGPGEGIALQAAIDAYTSGAAWAAFDEQRKGTIEPGMLADLVVLSRDIFDAPLSELPNTTVMYTIFDGRIVYRWDGRESTD